MTPEEANKIIAECMGFTIQEVKEGHAGIHAIYHESLDALVPVWEKHKIEMIIDINNMQVSATAHKGITSHTESLHYFTVEEAAAIATAKAIQELST